MGKRLLQISEQKKKEGENQMKKTVMVMLLAAVTTLGLCAAGLRLEMGAGAGYAASAGEDGTLVADASLTLWPLGREDALAGGLAVDVSAFTATMSEDGIQLYPFVEGKVGALVSIPLAGSVDHYGFALSGRIGAGIGYRYVFPPETVGIVKAEGVHALMFYIPFSLCLDIGSSFSLLLGADADFILSRQTIGLGGSMAYDGTAIGIEITPSFGFSVGF